MTSGKRVDTWNSCRRCCHVPFCLGFHSYAFFCKNWRRQNDTTALTLSHVDGEKETFNSLAQETLILVKPSIIFRKVLVIWQECKV